LKRHSSIVRVGFIRKTRCEKPGAGARCILDTNVCKEKESERESTGQVHIVSDLEMRRAKTAKEHTKLLKNIHIVSDLEMRRAKTAKEHAVRKKRQSLVLFYCLALSCYYKHSTMTLIGDKIQSRQSSCD
jgi:hypothetical protein